MRFISGSSGWGLYSILFVPFIQVLTASPRAQSSASFRHLGADGGEQGKGVLWDTMRRMKQDLGCEFGSLPTWPSWCFTPPNSPMTRPLSQSLLSPTPLSVTPWEEGKQTILMYRGRLGAEFPAGKIARKSHGHSDQQESEAQEDRTPEDRRIFSVNLEAFKRFNKLQPWSRRMHWESFLVHSSLYLLALQRAGFHKESLKESQWGLLWQPSG